MFFFRGLVVGFDKVSILYKRVIEDKLNGPPSWIHFNMLFYKKYLKVIETLKVKFWRLKVEINHELLQGNSTKP